MHNNDLNKKRYNILMEIQTKIQTENQPMNQKVQYEKLNNRKHCKGCDEIKPFDQFNKSKSKCKECMKIVNSNYYRKVKDIKQNKDKLTKEEKEELIKSIALPLYSLLFPDSPLSIKHEIEQEEHVPYCEWSKM